MMGTSNECNLVVAAHASTAVEYALTYLKMAQILVAKKYTSDLVFAGISRFLYRRSAKRVRQSALRLLDPSGG
jgi:hypothetical protein